MARDVSDVTHRKRGLRFEKSQLVELDEFCMGSRVRYETLEEGWSTHWPKGCEFNNVDEDTRSNTLNDKN